MDNRELTREGYARVADLVDYLRGIKVDGVTVAISMLIPIIRERAPEIPVSVSSLANIDTLDKARQFERMGVQGLTLYEDHNRNFALLKRFRRHLTCDLRLIATNSCRLSCRNRVSHANANAHASQAGHASNGFLLDWPILECVGARLASPVELLKATWIRPEDLHRYEEIGFEHFKLTERFKTTERLLETVAAYRARRFDGNLLRLTGTYAEASSLPPNFELLHRAGMDQDERCAASGPLFGALGHVIVDNRALDGFIDHFVRNSPDCPNLVCGEECRYCFGWVERAVRLDGEVPGLSRAFGEFFARLAHGPDGA
ncbi:MAG: U32 family peptidase [Myxococcales bacterium]